jgi:flagellar basal-body rod modification protein FlgD
MSVSDLTATSPSSLLTLPNAASTVAQAKAKAQAASSSSSSTSGLDGTTAGTTFLNLLVKELQNQDPTAPMDSTSMVGQMISLNQLDQLISINQTLGSASTSTTGTSTQAVSSSSLVAARAALLNGSSSATDTQANALAAMNPNSTLDLSNLSSTYGGK